MITALLGLGACGWFAVAPFKREVRYAGLVAPFAGMLLLALATLAGYVLLKLPLRLAGFAGLGATVGLSLLAVDWRGPRPSARVGLLRALLGLGVSAVVVRLTMATSLQFGGAAMLYADGTDHLGYAHLADWLMAHPVTVPPALDVTRPYESWPNLLMQIDPRFGSHTLLALVALASGHSAMFSYDLTTAVVLAASVLAVAAVFARTPVTLGLLVTGLIVSHWFDYGRSGYLGKILGYPAALVVGGLYLRAAARGVRVPELISLTALAAAGAMMHSGLPLALLAGLIGGGYLLGDLGGSWREGRRMEWATLREKIVSLGLVMAAALVATGTLARPLSTGFPDWHLDWTYILPRIADMESQGVPMSGLSAGWLQGLTWGLLGIGLAGGAMAVIFRIPAAMALLLGPLLLLAGLYGMNARAVTFQLIGTFFPLGLCGLAVLRDELTGRAPPHGSAVRLAPVALGLAVMAVGLHVPRFLGAVARFGGADTPATARFSEQQMNHLAEYIGEATVDVDIPDNPRMNLAVMVELGRRGLQLQWQPASWRQIQSFRPWAPPVYAARGKFRLVAVDGFYAGPAGPIVCETEQYLLLESIPTPVN